MEFVNKSISLHKSTDLEQNLLLHIHYEVFDPILSCYNQEKLPLFYSSQANEHFQKFKIRDSSLSLCVVPYTFNFPEIIDWCTSHYSIQNQSIISQVNSKILLTVNTKEIQRMLGLDSTNFAENNTVPLVEENLIKKFTNLSPQEQISFVHSLQKPEHLFQTLNFPLKTEFYKNPIQLILSMFVQIIGLNHDQAILESFLGFLLFLSEDTKFNYPKYIADFIHDQFANYSSLNAF